MSEATDLRRGADGALARPDRLALLGQMLQATNRRTVPIRRAFLQTPKPAANGARNGPLSRLVRDPAALDAYLMIHAMASASEPYDTWYPVPTWAQVCGLTEYAELPAARSRWAKLVTRLEKERLICRDRSGNRMAYLLRHESGSGEPYTRPKAADHGHWFSVPHVYWLGSFDRELTTPEKVMLLISLDQQDDFRLPADRAPAWYGISESTARRGFHGLVDRGILTVRSANEPEAKSPTGWKETLYYTTTGDWSHETRKQLNSRKTVAFEDTPDKTKPREKKK